MRTLIIFLTVILCLSFIGCASWTVQGGISGQRSDRPAGGGVMVEGPGRTPRQILDNSTLLWPTSAGGLVVFYETGLKQSTYVSEIRWFVDGILRENGPRFHFGNPANGDHEIRCEITSAWAGDNRYADTEIFTFTVRTWRDAY
ncbi:hypothetical protein C4546_03835 [Candidatus Parcubacteria bacterium]|jgi:hypothetical protein|nr:MAG: hypothetical protein C4546_03835 [Candidatus Parcubacteria bacterium]